ncbi:hypothetical protein [Thauera humireducens]|uniref:hypothetical protein n=1 Tax=Thauera humireducens TaxID=1134435 RepID=UPI00311D6601
MLAISGNTPDIAFMLVEQGADVFASRRDGETALSLAQKQSDVRLLRLIEFKVESASRRLMMWENGAVFPMPA